MPGDVGPHAIGEGFRQVHSPCRRCGKCPCVRPLAVAAERDEWLGVGGQVAGLLGSGCPASEHLEAVSRRGVGGCGVGEQGQAGVTDSPTPPMISARPR